MSKAGISTADLVALANETNSLVTPGLMRAFNAAATPKQKQQDSVYVSDAQALRNEGRSAPRGVGEEFKRLLCMSIIERTEHGVRSAMRGLTRQDEAEIFARARALSGKRKVNNSRRAQQLEQAGAPTLARIVRMAV